MTSSSTPSAIERSVAHSVFTIERTYAQSPARVFGAFASQEAVRRWRIVDDTCVVQQLCFDFYVGGREVAEYTYSDRPQTRLEAEFQDIVQDQRIVFAYRMSMEASPLSASLATIEFFGAGSGTRLKYTEQGAFFDGLGTAKEREHGWRLIFESLQSELQRQTP